MGWTERLADSRAERGLGRLNELALLGCLMLDGGLRGYTQDLAGREFGDPLLGRLYDLVQGHEGPVDAVVVSNIAARAGAPGEVHVAIGEAMDFLPLPERDVVIEYARWIKRAAVERKVEEYRRAKVMGM